MDMAVTTVSSLSESFITPIAANESIIVEKEKNQTAEAEDVKMALEA